MLEGNRMNIVVTDINGSRRVFARDRVDDWGYSSEKGYLYLYFNKKVVGVYAPGMWIAVGYE